MINIISLILIFLENSLALNYPYNFIAIPYITYLVYKKGVNSINYILLVALVMSLQSVKITTLAVGGVIFYLAFYMLSTVIAYERHNIPFIVAIQVILYGSMVYLKTGCLTFLILFKLIISYGVFNYLYIRKDEKFFRSI